MINNTCVLNCARLAIACCIYAGPAMAETDTVFDPYADARYRLEIVDQDGVPNNAAASTLRLRAGVRTREWSGFSAHVEAEAVVHIGPDDFNDTTNGRVAFPVVADPEIALLNQAYVQWRLPEFAQVRGGRQTINLDNQRWVGSVGWRQNDQTLDAVTASISPSNGLGFSYAYAWRVNRIFGPDTPQGTWRDTDIHMLRATANLGDAVSVTGYGYLLDIPAAPTSSSRSWGARATGNQVISDDFDLALTIEFARQSDHGNHPRDFSVSYLLIEPRVRYGPVDLRVGYERLGSNGVDALQTPLATLHAFNGWADVFLRTPPAGLRDIYADITVRPFTGGPLEGAAFRAAFHDFRSARGGIGYGREWDLQFSVPIHQGWSVLAKYADYHSGGFAADRRKLWLSTQISF